MRFREAIGSFHCSRLKRSRLPIRAALSAMLVICLSFSGFAQPDLFSRQNTGFSQMMPNLPLMPGMVEEPELSSVFSQPEGRIYEIWVYSDAEEDEVITFYEETLPQLGWQKTDQETVFVTAQGVEPAEELSLAFTNTTSTNLRSDDQITVVIFRLSPL